jgi:hypothetical protein
MDKHQKLIAQIQQEMGRKTTNELLEIWVENNRYVWSEKAFEAIQLELRHRKVDIPAQAQPKERLRGVDSWTAEAMKRDIRKWGVVLVSFGALHFLLKGNLYYQWGGILIILGAIHFIVNHHAIYLFDGLFCLGVAILDVTSGKPMGWYQSIYLFLGAFVFVTKFAWYSTSREKQIEVLTRLGRLPKENHSEDISQTHGRISPNKVKKLIAQLKRNREWIDWMTRKDAADALGELGPLAQEAIPALMIALEDEKKDVRQAAAKALEKIR